MHDGIPREFPVQLKVVKPATMVWAAERAAEFLLHKEALRLTLPQLGCGCGYQERNDESTNTKERRVLHDEGRPEKPKDSQPPWIREETFIFANKLRVQV